MTTSRNAFTRWRIPSRGGGGAVCRFAAVAGVLASNWLLPVPQPSVNDLHLRWLIRGRNYFTLDKTNLLRTNPELLKLDNVKVRFSPVKEAGSVRIFCVGGSTTQGWPFHTRISYPRLLSNIIRDALPNRQIEVINAGIMGSDSSSDIKLVEEIAAYQPDLLILNEGRNEKWGLALHAGWKAMVLNVHAWLLQYIRLYGYGWAIRRSLVESRFDHSQSVWNWAERSRHEVAPRLKPLFRRNMERMIAMMTKRGCSVVLLTQIVSPEEDGINPGINEINDWIRDLAKEKKTSLVDLDVEFRKRWDDATDLIIPYPTTHPTLPGYELMARIIAHKLQEQVPLLRSSAWQWGRVHSNADFERFWGADDPDYLAEIYANLAVFFVDIRQPQIARRYLAWRHDLARPAKTRRESSRVP